MRKRDELTVQTRQNIVDAFWLLYCEKRIEKITVSNITEKAGYNRSTFYEYFEDVYDVLAYIENLLIPTLEELPPVSTPTGTIGMPLDLFLKLYEHNCRYYSVLLGDNGDPAFASKLKNSIKPTIRKMFEENPNVDCKKLEYILEYTLSAMIGIMSFWFQQKDAPTSEELFELIHCLMENGVIKQLPFQ